MSLAIFELDPTLKPLEAQIWDRFNGYKHWKGELEKNEGGIDKFAEGYKIFGFTRGDGGYTYREWLPNAKQVFLTGDFNNWENTMPLKAEDFGRWSVFIPDKPDGSPGIAHRSLHKVRLETNDGQWHERVPAWTKLAWQDTKTNLFNGVFWEPPKEDRYVFKHNRPARPASLKIYEAHVGMGSFEPKVATYTEFADNVLPRIRRLGYNAVQLMAVSEHAHYGCFGYHVTSFYAPASRSGTPEELKYMIDTAHSLGIAVLMDLVHAHASSNSLDGIAQMDGTDHCYTHGGAKGHHSEWDSSIFHYTKYEVMRFLLSNVRWWLEEYGFDGFRFDGITSMLYHSHGIGKGYTGGYHEYFGADADIDSHIYLMLANDLIHQIVPSAITVGEDVSGMPTLCRPVEDGGFGFDYRLAMAIPDMFIKLLKEQTDDSWQMGHITHTLTNRRWKEKVVAYCESHDQAIVGDKTLAFWLMDAEMYTGMSCLTQPTASMCVDRGLALHKMIRLVVLGLGGEAYLNFMGNEFGHPEWIDFPRPENGWSHHLCRRRWDLAEDDLLRYKFFQSFDELMQACENRYGWLDSDHQYVSVKNEGDKVIAFERGDLLFVFNFHPCQSFEGYQIGMKWDEPMRCVLDTDEGRFGGHTRLEYGHGNSFPPQGPTHNRPNSIKIYMPPRTAQVLIRESVTQGGVRIWLHEEFLAGHGLKGFTGISIEHEEDKKLNFDSSGCCHLAQNNSASFKLFGPKGELPCKASKDTQYRAYFPGDYTVCGAGYLEVGKPSDVKEGVSVDAAAVAKTTEAPASSPPADVPKQAAASPKQAAAPKPEAKAAGGYTSTSPPAAAPKAPAASVEQKSEKQAPAASVEQKSEKQAGWSLSSLFNSSSSKPPTSPVAKTAPPAAETASPAPQVADDPVQAAALDEDAAEDGGDFMMRNYSGLHFLAAAEEALAAEAQAREEDKAKTPRAEPAEVNQNRVDSLKVAMQELGGSLTDFAKSYKLFGLQKCPGGLWTFREWIPKAKGVYLVGDFNKWDNKVTALAKDSKDTDVWSCEIKAADATGLTTGSKYKIYVEPDEGAPYYVCPAWSTCYVESQDIVDAVICPLEGSAPKPLARPPGERGDGERIFEMHCGLFGREGKTAGFVEAAEGLLPKVLRNGFTSVLLIGALECKEYASMGLQPVGLFAPARELGKPEDLRFFISKAHEMGLRVLLSIAHDGLACVQDGLNGFLFVQGVDGFHRRTGARIFDYAQSEVQRYLLANLCFWVEQFGMDGFRFQSVHSIIYSDRGMFPPEDPSDIDEYLRAGRADKEGIRYLMLATDMLNELKASGTPCITIAEEPTLFPRLCEPTSAGGLGFDMRQISQVPETLRTLVNSRRDEEWGMSELAKVLRQATDARQGERVVGCMETVEECTVGRRPLKIAMLSWETLHTIAAGGVAPHVSELAAALRAGGHDVHIFTRSTQAGTWEHKVWGVVYHEVAFGHNSDFVCEIENMCGAFVGALCEAEAHMGCFDIIHGHDWLVGPAIAQLAGMGKRTVFTMHSTETGRCGNVAYAGQSARIRSIEGHACHVAQRVIAVSGVLKEEVCSYYSVDGRKVEVIYNGIHADPIVNMEWQDDWTGNTKRDKGFNVMDPMFLFVGRLAVQKGPDLLLEAIPFVLQARNNAKFVIVGDGHMKSALEARAAQLGISHAVVFAGSVKSGTPHLKALFKSCDAVVIPSRNEPFGIVVLEAWAAGKPVIATTCGGPRDFVSNDKEGYLVDPNPGSISWGICKICENFDHARWMGLQAKEKTLRDFNWSYIARQTEKIYYEQMCLYGAPFRRSPIGGAPLAASLLGPHRDGMGVLSGNVLVDRGISMLKLMRLLSGSLGCAATLTWMGSEVGQIDSTDMPRGANGFNATKVDYGPANDKGLKFKHLEMFETCLNRTEAVLKWLSKPSTEVLIEDETAKVLVFARAGCIFAMNFHPADTAKSYRVVARDVANDLSVALNTDDSRFGGSGSGAALYEEMKVRGGAISLTLPPRSAVVLAPVGSTEKLKADRVLQLRNADELPLVADSIKGA